MKRPAVSLCYFCEGWWGGWRAKGESEGWGGGAVADGGGMEVVELLKSPKLIPSIKLSRLKGPALIAKKWT